MDTSSKDTVYVSRRRRRAKFTPEGRSKLKQLVEDGVPRVELLSFFGVTNYTLRKELIGLNLHPRLHRHKNVNERLVTIGSKQQLVLTADGKSSVKAMITAGTSYREIALVLGLSYSTARALLSSEGLMTLQAAKLGPRLSSATPELEDEIVDLYLHGIDRASIADRLNCRQQVVIETLVDKGVPRYRITSALKKLSPEDRKFIRNDIEAYFRDRMQVMRKLWHLGLPFSARNLLMEGIPESQHLFLRNSWPLKSGLTRQELERGHPDIADTAKFLEYVDPILAKLPYTAATNKSLEPTDIYYRRLLAITARIPDIRLRNMLGIGILARSTQDKSFHGAHGHLNSLRRALEGIASSRGYGTLFDPERFGILVRDMLKGRAPDIPLTDIQAAQFLGAYRNFAHLIYAYLDLLPAHWKDDLAHYLPLQTENLPILRHVKWHGHVREGQEARRKAKTDIVHLKFYDIRTLSTRRLMQMRAVYDAVRSAAEEFDPSVDEPYSFTCLEPVVPEDKDGPMRKLRFQLYTAKYIACMMNERPPKNWKKLPYLVRYIDYEMQGDAPDMGPPWWVKFLEHRVTSANRDYRASFNKENGYPEGTDWTFPLTIGRRGRTTIQTARLTDKDGWLFFDINRFYTATLVGALVAQLGTKTGMRLGEMQQIAASPKCLVELHGVEERSTPVRGVRVIPKGRTKKETKYIDDQIFDLIVQPAVFQCELLGSKKLPTIKPGMYKEGLPKERYIFQFQGKPLDQGMISQCLRFVLDGLLRDPESGLQLVVSAHMLRHAFATELAQQGVNIDVIAKLLSHRRIEPTLYYSEPPAHILRRTVHAICIDRTIISAKTIRSPSQVLGQLERAKTLVGGLTEVIGGVCTVGFPCLKKFDCIGCPGNAPDPLKREQVVVKRNTALTYLKWAQSNRLPQEARIASKIIDDCDLMLREMDLLAGVSPSVRKWKASHGDRNYE